MLDEKYNDGLVVYGQGEFQSAMNKWLSIADKGHMLAQYNLGVIFHNGQAVPLDSVQAAKWYLMAADQGHLQAQFNLGLMYVKGDGVPQDFVLAHLWLNLASAQGDEVARENRDYCALKMTRHQIADAQRMARDWTEKHQS